MDTPSSILFVAGLGMLILGSFIVEPGRFLVIFNLFIPLVSKGGANIMRSNNRKTKKELKEENLKILNENPSLNSNSRFVFLGLGLLLILAALTNNQFHFLPSY